MFDWFLILFLSAISIIYCLEIVVEHRTVNEYFATGQSFGVKKGTVLVWGTFYTSWTVIIPAYSSVKFGLGISTIFWLITILLIFVFLTRFVPYVREKGVVGDSLPDLYSNRFPGKNGKSGIGLLAIANMDGLIIQPALAGWLYSMLFDKNPFIFLLVLFVFVIILSGLGGVTALSQTSWLLLLVSGCALIFLPLYTYLESGVFHVFHDYHSWSENLPLQKKDYLLFLVSVIILLIGKLSTNIMIWRNIFSIKEVHYSSIIKLGILGIASIPLSLLAFFTYEFIQYQTTAWDSLLKLLMSHESYLILQFAMVVWLIGIAHSAMFSLHSLISLYIFHVEKEKPQRVNIRTVYFTSIIIGIIGLALSSLLVPYALQAIQSYLLFFSLTAIPCFMILFKRRELKAWMFLIMAISFVLSIIMFIIYGNFSNSFLLSLFVSVVLSGFLYFRFSEVEGTRK